MGQNNYLIRGLIGNTPNCIQAHFKFIEISDSIEKMTSKTECSKRVMLWINHWFLQSFAPELFKSIKIGVLSSISLMLILFDASSVLQLSSGISKVTKRFYKISCWASTCDENILPPTSPIIITPNKSVAQAVSHPHCLTSSSHQWMIHQNQFISFNECQHTTMLPEKPISISSKSIKFYTILKYLCLRRK